MSGMNDASRTNGATRVHVDGASGYGGGELMRLLARHPEFTLGALASKSSAHARLGDVFPSLAPLGRAFDSEEELDRSVRPGDFVVHAGEAEGAHERVASFLQRGARVVDLSAGHRPMTPAAYQQWYGTAHPDRALLEEAAYGIPELYSSRIAAARLVANPGCYPTATLLALAPLVARYGTAIARIAVDAKSGISGAGRSPKTSSLFSEVASSIRPYGARGHRHMSEIAEQLSSLGCGAPLVFIPHVVPLSRGMLATCYVWFSRSAPRARELEDAFAAAYEHRPLILVLPEGSLPETRSVAGTARAAVGFARVSGDAVVCVCAIDNLGKGAAGQAVQNLNIMHELPEESGLDALATVA